MKFQLVQDKCSLLDQYQEGQKIKVSFDLKGREWQGKFFTNLGAWRIDGVDASKPIADSKEPQGFDSFEPIENPFNSGPEDFQDLPF